VLIAVGSTRGPKVEAVRRVLSLIGERLPGLSTAEVVALDVVDAPPMPLAVDEMLDGARSRAHLALEALQARGFKGEFGIGLEGGIDLRRADPLSRRGFLMSWAYVTDGRRGAHGCGGAIEVPTALLDRVVDEGIELAQAVDDFAKQLDVRSKQGAWGVLSDGLFDRQRSFEIALINAFAPFYNREAYE
jgi:non-canonical (house-cleaning) NTP pyrophosphatase